MKKRDFMVSNLKNVGVNEEGMGDRVKWKCRTSVTDPKYFEEKSKGVENNMYTLNYTYRQINCII